MNVINLAIPDVKRITPRRFQDKRGFFQQSYHRDLYAEAGMDTLFVQDNWSRSTKGVLRGLHYQYEQSQAKLVSVIQGEVFDVAVDMRKDSETFGQWVGEILSGENGNQLFVPKGFAHGFLVMSDTVDLMYKCDAVYTPGDEYGVKWDDPAIGIEWPMDLEPVLLEKDAGLPLLKDAVHF